MRTGQMAIAIVMAVGTVSVTTSPAGAQGETRSIIEQAGGSLRAVLVGLGTELSTASSIEGRGPADRSTPSVSSAQVAPAASSGRSPRYRPPTDRAVSAPFRVDHGPYGPGNRGLDYAVVPGDPIRAIGAGTVVFAGSVAGERFVTVLHPDGLRSSYSYLSEIRVAVGDTVQAGQVVATTTGRFQLGVRRGQEYLDPASLFGPPERARLVPGRRD